jgi:hypothetical protein
MKKSYGRRAAPMAAGWRANSSRHQIATRERSSCPRRRASSTPALEGPAFTGFRLSLRCARSAGMTVSGARACRTCAQVTLRDDRHAREGGQPALRALARPAFTGFRLSLRCARSAGMTESGAAAQAPLLSTLLSRRYCRAAAPTSCPRKRASSTPIGGKAMGSGSRFAAPAALNVARACLGQASMGSGSRFAAPARPE